MKPQFQHSRAHQFREPSLQLGYLADDVVGVFAGDPADELPGAGAHQDGNFRKLVIVAAKVLDALADEARLLVGIPQCGDGELFAGGVVAPWAQGLAEARVVMGDQPGGGGEDRRGGAIVAFETDHFRAGEIRLEAKDVLHLRAASGITRVMDG